MRPDDFFESTVRIEAIDLFGRRSPRRYIPARVGSEKYGVFSANFIGDYQVEIGWHHQGGKLQSQQTLDLARSTRQFLRCPRCAKWCVRLFFIAQGTTTPADFSFLCLDCAVNHPFPAGATQDRRRAARRSPLSTPRPRRGRL